MTYNDFLRQVLAYLKTNPDSDELIEKRDSLIAFAQTATTRELVRDANLGVKLIEEELFDRQVLMFCQDRSA